MRICVRCNGANGRPHPNSGSITDTNDHPLRDSTADSSSILPCEEYPSAADPLCFTPFMPSLPCITSCRWHVTPKFRLKSPKKLLRLFFFRFCTTSFSSFKTVRFFWLHNAQFSPPNSVSLNWNRTGNDLLLLSRRLLAVASISMPLPKVFLWVISNGGFGIFSF